MNGMYALNNYYTICKKIIITSSSLVVSNYTEIEDKDDWSVSTWVVLS